MQGADIDKIFSSIKEIRQAIRNVALPFNGFDDPKYHVFCTSPSLKDTVLARKASTVGRVDRSNIPEIDPNLIAFAFYKGIAREKVYKTAGEDTGSFIAHLLSGMHYSTMVVPRLNYLFSYQFFGVQSTGFKGFTFFRDRKIDSFEDSQMHYVLSPKEYIMHGLDVRAAQDGIVTEVVNDKPDVVKDSRGITFASWNPEEHLGNVIRTKQDGIQYTYGSLMQNSIKLKVGDRVAKGQFLAKAGCSGFSRVPMLYFQVSTIGPRPSVVGNMGIPIHQGLISWDPHLQCDLIDAKKLYVMDYDNPDHDSNFRAVDSLHVQYKQTMHEPTAACLVKKIMMG